MAIGDLLLCLGERFPDRSLSAASQPWIALKIDSASHFSWAAAVIPREGGERGADSGAVRGGADSIIVVLGEVEGLTSWSNSRGSVPNHSLVERGGSTLSNKHDTSSSLLQARFFLADNALTDENIESLALIVLTFIPFVDTTDCGIYSLSVPPLTVKLL